MILQFFDALSIGTWMSQLPLSKHQSGHKIDIPFKHAFSIHSPKIVCTFSIFIRWIYKFPNIIIFLFHHHLKCKDSFHNSAWQFILFPSQYINHIYFHIIGFILLWYLKSILWRYIISVLKKLSCAYCVTNISTIAQFPSHKTYSFVLMTFSVSDSSVRT